MKKLFLFLCLASLLTAFAVELDYSKYGAGPMLKPNRTYYVSPKGNDKNDGSTLEKAFKSLWKGTSVLKAGDTLLLDEGNYFQAEVQINVKPDTVGFSGQCGRPGAPIRIMGMKGKNAVLIGGRQLRPLKRKGQFAEFSYNRKINYDMIQELPSGIELQRVADRKIVEDTPGTFFYDEKNKYICVHFAALEQTGISVAAQRVGLRIHGSYIHVENLEFRYFYEGIYARMNTPYDKNVASHITIQNCRFFYNYKSGIVLDGTRWSLVKNNQGAFNTIRGHFMNLKRAEDNLYLGNWCGSTANTLRQKKENKINYGINSYGGNPPRNHVVANWIESALSYRWKGGGAGNIVKDNMFAGVWHAESKPIPVVMTGNLFKSRVSWPGICGYNGWEKDFKDTPVKFYGNFRKEEDFKCSNPELLKAKSLRVKFPEPKFPAVTFKGLRADFIGKDGAAVVWETPDCDGWAEVVVNKKGARQRKFFTSPLQGSKHVVGITGLEPGTEYEFQAGFKNRRGWKKSFSKKFSFKTTLTDRAPRVLEVGKGKLTLAEASVAAIAGDTVKLLPGVHHGRFIPIRNGKPGKPITLSGGGKALIDGMKFYAPMVYLAHKHHIVIDGVNFINGDFTSGAHVIVLYRGSNVTIKNCRMIDLDWRAGNFIQVSGTPETLIQNNMIHGGAYPVSISGKKVKIINNTIVDATMLSLSLWGVDEIEIRNNIFYRPCIQDKRNPAILLTDAGKKIISEGNVFWSPLKEHPVGGRIRDAKIKVIVNARTLKEWQTLSGLDKTSVHTDPRFVNYAKGDFRLKPDSPVRGKGASL